MGKIIKTEEAAQMLAGLAGLYFLHLSVSWWLWIPLFFLPDISMLGYLAGTKVGAFTYNLFHHKGVAIIVAAIGLYLANNIIIAIGILLFAHSSFDRMFGYGLKYPDSFQHTHLGMIGKKK
jgi:ABC-type nitrate/sulfonate/bicarbonate transport system permease component